MRNYCALRITCVDGIDRKSFLRLLINRAFLQAVRPLYTRISMPSLFFILSTICIVMFVLVGIFFLLVPGELDHPFTVDIRNSG